MLERALRGLKAVGNASQVGRLAAEEREEASDHEAVGVVDSARTKGFARLHEFVAREEDADPELAVDIYVGAADRRRHADGARRHAHAFFENHRTRGNVGTLTANPSAFFRCAPEYRQIALALHFFLRHDRVGALGHRRPRKDSRAGAGLNRDAHLAGGNALGNGKAHGRIF